ncbi:uncharacterized protein LOC144050638 isoform X2 [Vanacampus margaritifer]
MSQSIRRRSSIRQLLENLIQVTAQRSLEDAEEAERERRRRTREMQRDESNSLHQQNKTTFSGGLDEEVKPSCCFVQEEDEGFSDWGHRLENRNDLEHFRVKEQEPLSTQWEAGRNDKKQEDDDKQEGWQPTQRSRTLQSTSPPLGKKEVKPPFCTKVFLSNDPRQQQACDPPAKTIPRMAAPKMSEGVCMVKQEEQGVQQILQEQRSDNSSDRPAYENDQGEEDLNFSQEEMKERLAEFEGSQKLAEERSKGEGCKSDEDKNKQSGLSVYSSEEDETLNCYGAMSPTFKKLLIQFYPDEAKCRIPTDGKCVITERTESLRKSSNNKKIAQPLCISKIDKKLQQYTHALEISSKECKTTSPVLVDVISPLAHKKSLFEAGMESNQNTLSNTSPKEIKAGDVLNKKNVWESFSDIVSFGSSGRASKECSAGKKSKFVVTAYGKYEKVPDGYGCRDDANWTA